MIKFSKILTAKPLLLGALMLGKIVVVRRAFAAELVVNTVTEFITKIMCPIVDTMFVIILVISSIMVLYAAFTYLSAGGDAEKVKTATKTITYAVVGVIVALVAKGFPRIVAAVFDSTLDNPAC